MWSSFSYDWTGTALTTNGCGHTNGAAQPGTVVWGYIVPQRPGISNIPPANIATGSADLRADLFTTGHFATAAAVYWGKHDHGTNALAWDFTNFFGGALSEGIISTNVSIPGSPAMVYYRFLATNAAGIHWSPFSSSFLSGEVWLDPLSAEAAEESLRPATVMVCRAGQATNGQLTVFYQVSGTASAGVDYVSLPGSVTISEGETNAPIVIQPIWNPESEPTETVVISILPGPYAAGSASCATVGILDYVVGPGLNTTIKGGPWTDVGTWSLGRPPIEGDQVVVAHTNLIEVATPALSSLTVNADAMLVFTGALACVTADAVTVHGAVTHVPNTATNAPWAINGMVRFVCGDFTLAAGGVINVDGKGYQAKPASSFGSGPGGGPASDWGTGGSYGGEGQPDGSRHTYPAPVCGTAAWPEWPGSSGGSGYPAGTYGGAGGGLVWILATNSVVLDGLITANGTSVTAAHTHGGGSGGGVAVSCMTIEGSGRITARGGDGGPYTPNDHGGGGGGGRIAVIYDPVQQAAKPKPAITFDVSGGRGGDSPYPRAMPGTVYLSDASLHQPSVITNPVCLIISNRTSWSPGHIFVSNVWFRMQEAVEISATNDIILDGTEARLDALAPARLSCRDFLLTNGSTAWLYSGQTNSPAEEYGGLLNVSRTMFLSSNSTLYLVCNATNGAGMKIATRTAIVQEGAVINADGGGFRGWTGSYKGLGPGGGVASDVGSGAGHGGTGGGNVRGNPGGTAYGDIERPLTAGSAGGNGANRTGGGHGGGLLWITASDRLVVNGIISASGQAPIEGTWCHSGYAAGGGSGGSIYIQAHLFFGSGLLRANGGNAGSYLSGLGAGGGAGGRIAVWRVNSETCSVSVAGGTGYEAGAQGTVYWGRTAPPGTVFVVH